MSKLFEALQKTSAALPEADMPLLTEDAENVFEAFGAEAPAPEAPQIIPAVAVMPQPVRTAATPLKKTSDSECRTLPVHLTVNNPILPFDSGSRRSIEEYRVIRTKLQHHPAQPRVIAVTSAGPGDGKTVTSINLAGAMSLNAGARVLLIDGDLRRSSIARLLGLPPEPGLTDLLSRNCTLEESLVRLQQFPNCFVLPAGTHSTHPPELLDSTGWRELLVLLRQSFDHVILDTPPVAAVADYQLIEAICDGVVMVARPDHTRRSAFKAAAASIDQTKLLGVIVNDVQEWFLWDSKGHSGYAYYDALDITQMHASAGARISST
jgi:capsular exopolysaccharide synthesis family protein